MPSQNNTQLFVILTIFFKLAVVRLNIKLSLLKLGNTVAITWNQTSYIK